MTYEKAISALIDEGLLNKEKTEAAIMALKGHSVAFTYPDWAKALAEVGVVARMNVDKAADVMQEAEEDSKEFDKALRRVGVY